ncbi:family 10 glycosylhydrolase [Salinimicrobium tongyeongense]|uniref:Family 10 glycosylhydrolase n=1 Tax=Salinimicrobium tongyeongense TaxID=2809707 RepID=A0ABY6NUW3_9FLAO|nr:family 10 glycosylhydrolase [Salinimicrobium tongyeongense]UZH56707.1 family 10 glycosylhydrolase [Salinimicrobium tongyeongense]
MTYSSAKIKLLIIGLGFSFGLNGCSGSKPAVHSGKAISEKEVRKPEGVGEKMPAVTPQEVFEELPVTPEADKEKPVKANFINSPFVMREFRAAWIATVANINWPSKAGLSTAQQQKEAINLLDFLVEHNYNAVIFQARPQADALYESELEPWSFFLTGVQGQAPDPYYDPLQFWLDAAHERGLEFHVWLNPYRAHHSTGGEVTPASAVTKYPNFMVKLKNGMWWMDPAKKATQDHTSKVVMDIVKRYDIDGIHFDDYFYPYASYNKGEDFPDAATYLAYQQEGGELSKPDWRRDNVNKFVKRIYSEIKEEKPMVKFGISPFGIYRPGYPRSITGMDQYSELYADARLWLNEGWVDYYAPQLYWKISQAGQSFPVLLGWWEKENHYNRHLWPGINIDFGGDDLNLIETLSQIMITRGMLPNSKGNIQWSIGPLLKYPHLSAGILEKAYHKKALVPASPWLDERVPAKPSVEIINNGKNVTVEWEHASENDVFKWVVHYMFNGQWDYKILNKNQRSLLLPLSVNGHQLSKIGVTAVNRNGNQSEFFEKKVIAPLP